MVGLLMSNFVRVMKVVDARAHWGGGWSGVMNWLHFEESS
jgi:hypothetical protein